MLKQLAGLVPEWTQKFCVSNKLYGELGYQFTYEEYDKRSVQEGVHNCDMVHWAIFRITGI